MVRQALHTWIWGFSEILLYRSSQVLSGWMETIGGHFQVFPERYSIGFKSGLWLGHSRTFTEVSLSNSCIVLAVFSGSLSCWKVNLWPNLKFWVLWTRFSLRISPYFASSLLLNPDHPPPAKKHPHSMMLQPPCFTIGYWAGDERCLVSSRHDA